MSIFFAGNMLRQRHGIFNSPFAKFTMSYLVVAGGGGAGGLSQNGDSGGGGAGGLLTGTISGASGITFVATRGVGGLIGSTDGIIDFAGSNGGNSSLVYGASTILAYGGGGGASANQNAVAGGSGGGGNYIAVPASGVSGQGYNGGLGDNSGDMGGGGGAGGLGGNAYYDAPNDTYYSGAGGIGLPISITGTSVNYAVGAIGNGAGNTSQPDTIGYGGYGSGGNATDQINFGNGYNGIIIISVPTSKYTGNVTNAVVTTSGSNTIIAWSGLSGTYIS